MGMVGSRANNKIQCFHCLVCFFPETGPEYGCKEYGCTCPAVILCADCSRNYKRIRLHVQQEYNDQHGCIACCRTCHGQTTEYCAHTSNSFMVLFTQFNRKSMKKI